MKIISLFIIVLICAGLVRSENCKPLPNIYWFGSSQDDPGNWIRLYGTGDGRSWAPFQEISSPVFSYPSPINAIGIEVIGAENRFADGLISPDFLATKYNFTLWVAEEIDYLPVESGNIVCFGIAGSTATGNQYNSYVLNQPYSVITGSGSYQYQVDKFLLLQQQIPTPIVSEDIFIYSSLFATDILAVFNDWNAYGPSTTYSDMDLIGLTTITNLQNLAYAGAKRFVILMLDPESAYIIPNFIKYLPCTDEITNFIDYLLSIIDETLYNRLEAFQAEYNAEVNIVYYSELLNSTLTRSPAIRGFRVPFPNDVDPRTQYCEASEAALPFPTFMDAYLATEGNQLLYTTPWFDDRQVTSQTHMNILMPVISKYLNLLKC